MKQRIRRYVNEKHNVVTAEDDKKVVEFHGGVMGCRIAVAEVDTEAVDDMERKWAGISFLTNLQFEADGVRSRRSYGIGKGKLEKYSHLEPVKQKESNLNILQLFSLPSKSR